MVVRKEAKNPLSRNPTEPFRDSDFLQTAIINSIFKVHSTGRSSIVYSGFDRIENRASAINAGEANKNQTANTDDNKTEAAINVSASGKNDN